MKLPIPGPSWNWANCSCYQNRGSRSWHFWNCSRRPEARHFPSSPYSTREWLPVSLLPRLSHHPSWTFQWFVPCRFPSETEIILLADYTPASLIHAPPLSLTKNNVHKETNSNYFDSTRTFLYLAQKQERRMGLLHSQDFYVSSFRPPRILLHGRNLVAWIFQICLE